MAHSLPAPATGATERLEARPRRRPWRTLRGAVRASREHRLTTTARALAYSLFLAIPSTLLLLLGVFSLLADENDVDRVVRRLDEVVPPDVSRLLGESLERSASSPGSGVAMAVVGFALALWSATSAATSLMDGLTEAYGHHDRRGFFRRRLIALAIVLSLVVSALLLLGALILGPYLSEWVGDATGEPSLTSWLWWSAQWPILGGVLLLAIGVVLSLGPDAEEHGWRIVTPGTVVALFVWLAASAALAVYSARFGSYEKTWGTLSVVVVTLLWLWLGAASLLFGAEIDAQSRVARADDARDAARQPVADARR
jgi:membrane protein